ncbi:DUF1015 domain-containing protein [Flavobacterium sp. MAH-1]|uniref:DUF1015 domain-containing protein n=1 Tax=Flavobacterium agri TaxID=2743471 RepID=A0A7Y8Y4M7_9FLAO|nr:DUF1015 domain-containing protein [Flavobacterium agri]NUY82283.1 DUF1015 domain-containing protein [Flavobacterium agri]NYA72307.1 DUF1015 domain-containing protein [Flavobacterium agri]
MPKITPFAAVRPTRDKAALVTSRSYDDYSAAELAAQLDFNPFSFLHVLHPGYVNVQKNDPTKRFGQVRSKYTDFKSEGILKKETQPILYLYEMQSKSRSYTGIIAGVSIQDYLDGKIKKHEDTLEYRVEQFEEYLHITGFNTEPVLIAYPENKTLSDWISQTKSRRPLYLFSSPNRDRHTLWRIKEPAQIEWLQSEFAKIPSLYIADGHHRSASAALLYERDKDTGNANLSNFMALLVSEEQVKINEYNRVIRDLNGLNESEFLKKVSASFDIRNLGQELWKPTHKGEFGMYLNGNFYALKPLNQTSTVDAQLLYDELLAPILGIGDLRNDGRIEYIPGNQPLTKLVEWVDSDEFEVGFTLFPIAFQEIRELADRDEILPPKSTYIEPKIRSGLVIYEL